MFYQKTKLFFSVLKYYNKIRSEYNYIKNEYNYMEDKVLEDFLKAYESADFIFNTFEKLNENLKNKMKKEFNKHIIFINIIFSNFICKYSNLIEIKKQLNLMLESITDNKFYFEKRIKLMIKHIDSIYNMFNYVFNTYYSKINKMIEDSGFSNEGFSRFLHLKEKLDIEKK